MEISKAHLQNPSFAIFILFLFTSFCIISVFIWESHTGINLSDESFLWYGASAVSHGQVPIRDFYAYDPGRYYITAFVMKLLANDGIIVSRIAEAIFQGLGLFVALYMLIRELKFTPSNFIYFLIASLTVLVWMVPLYKIFDITASILLIALFTYLIETKTLTATFLTGIGISLIAIIGRNHGFYAAASCIGLIFYLSLNAQGYSLLSAIKWWMIGLLVGYLPLIAMLLFVPGFSDAFFKGISFLLTGHATNLYLPIPWPWHATTIHNFILGIFFISLLLFGIFSLIFLFLNKSKQQSAVLIACAFLALPYAHYAFSRADNIHLALGIFPFLIGILIYLHQIFNKSSTLMLLSVVILFTLSSIVAFPLHPSVQCYMEKNWQYRTITGSLLKVDLDTQIKLDMFERLIKQYAANGQSFLVTPFNFGMYTIFGRESPMWDLYPLFSRSIEDQTDDIARIKKANPGFIVIYNHPLDGEEKRQFHYTHSLIFKYISENYELIHDVAESADIYIYVRNSFPSRYNYPNKQHPK